MIVGADLCQELGFHKWGRSKRYHAGESRCDFMVSVCLCCGCYNPVRDLRD